MAPVHDLGAGAEDFGVGVRGGVGEQIVRPHLRAMKRWTIIFAAAAIAVLVVVTAVRDFSEAIQHFSSQPHQLLYVGCITIAGGLAALGFARLSPRAQRHIRVFAWGAAASTLTAFVAWFAFHLVSLASLVVESGGGVWAAVGLLLFSGIAAYLWFEFYRALKLGVPR